MNESSEMIKCFARIGEKIEGISKEDPIGNLVEEAVIGLIELTASNANVEKVRFAMASMETSASRVQLSANERNASMRRMVYDVTKSLFSTMEYITTKEESRVCSATSVKLLPSPDLDESDDINVDGGSDEGKETETEERMKPFKCDICEKRYVRKGALVMHSYSHLPLEERSKCEVCGEILGHGRKSQHMRTHAESEEERLPYACDLCTYRTSSAKCLPRHKRTHSTAEDERRPFKCDVCGKRYTQKTTLTHHMTIHFSSDGQCAKQTCDVCGKRVLKLTLHMRTHMATAEERLRYAKASLQRHMRTHSQNDEERKKYKCDQCEKRFTTMSNLTKHKIKHKSHMDEIEEENMNTETEMNLDKQDPNEGTTDSDSSKP